MNRETIEKIYGPLLEHVSVPIELYESILGKYFIGYADNLTFGQNTSAWARLYNPIGSGTILNVNVWTVTDVSTAPFRAQFWFNATPPASSKIQEADTTTTNLAIMPTPKAKAKLQYAVNVTGEPTGGIKAFVRRALPETTLVETENGKIIIPPGGNFMVFLSTPEAPETVTSGRVALGWWEEKIYRGNCGCGAQHR